MFYCVKLIVLFYVHLSTCTRTLLQTFRGSSKGNKTLEK
jgi:hypothetical protein